MTSDYRLSIAALCNLGSKAKTVLRHLKDRGSISPVEAAVTHRLPKVARQVWELRQAGLPIKTELRQDAAGTRYARYTLSVVSH